MFESSRARHDFNDLAGLAKQPLIAAEAPRKHSTGSNRTVCRTPVGNELASDELRTRGRAALTGGQYDCAQNTAACTHGDRDLCLKSMARIAHAPAFDSKPAIFSARGAITSEHRFKSGERNQLYLLLRAAA